MSEGISLAVLVDVAIAITIAEAVGLVLYWRWKGKGLPLSALAPNLLAAAGLMLALRSAVHADAWWWPAGFLLLAGVAHVIDIASRWRSADRSRAWQDQQY